MYTISLCPNISHKPRFTLSLVSSKRLGCFLLLCSQSGGEETVESLLARGRALELSHHYSDAIDLYLQLDSSLLPDIEKLQQVKSILIHYKHMGLAQSLCITENLQIYHYGRFAFLLSPPTHDNCLHYQHTSPTQSSHVDERTMQIYSCVKCSNLSIIHDKFLMT